MATASVSDLPAPSGSRKFGKNLRRKMIKGPWKLDALESEFEKFQYSCDWKFRSSIRATVGSNEFLTMSSSNAVPTVSVNSVGMRKGR